MRLLDLPPEVQNQLARGKLATGHAKVLLTLKKPKEQERAADEVIKKGLSVRATEKLVQSLLNPPPPKPEVGDNEFDTAIEAVEQKLVSHLNTNVSLHHSDKKGRIEIDYYGVEDLNRIIALLGVEEESFG
jgi:ParB family chromosome partitioning protein